MKTKLEIGKEYWLDGMKDESGVFIGLDGTRLLFKPSKNCASYCIDGGYVKFRDTGRNYDEVINTKPFQFTTPIAMKCTEEQFNGIKDKLVEMGYNTEGVWYLDTCDYLCTNFGGNDKDVYFSSTNIFQLNLFESFNPDLFLALAAMTDKEDGIKGEWWIGSSNVNLFEQSFEKNLNATGVFRKATAQEIIEHFEKKEFVLPYAYMVCVNSKEEYLSVLEYARTKGEFKEDFNDLTPNIFPYYIGMEKNGSWTYNNRYILSCDGVKITFDQFKKYVLKETPQSCQIIPIPPAKQATLFDDRVEITDWEPKEGEWIYSVVILDGNPTYRKCLFSPREQNTLTRGRIVRTESEAKQLVERLKQAML